MAEVRVGIVGCGGMGNSLASQLVTIDEVRFVAGADPFAESREQFGSEYSIPVYEDLDAMMGAEKLDAVIVATPNHYHAPVTIAAAAAGHHVFCEKPMALTVDDCQAMIDACHEAGVKLQIGQVLRYLPDFALALELLAEGQVGQPRHGMIFRYSPPKKSWGQAWRDDPSQVGHHLFEVAVHELDFMRCVFGRPVAASGWDLNLDPDSPLWSQATTAVVEFESGAICTLVEGMFSPLGRSEVEITGTSGALRFQWGQRFVYQPASGEGWEKAGDEVAAGREDGRRRELREWIEAIISDQPVTIPGEEGKANIELALAILAAHNNRCRVELPL